MIEGITIVIRSNGRKMTVRNNTNRFFYPSEWIAFYENLKANQKFTFHFLINTGARINEARNVKVKDIDFKNKTITLRVIKGRTNYSTGRIRIIPISSKFKKYLKKYIELNELKEKDYLGLLSTPGANLALKKSAKKSGIEDYYMLSVHSIRKSIETWLVTLNVGELKIMKHFGHDTTTALKHYIQPDLMTSQERGKISLIIGDLYYNDGNIAMLVDRVNELEHKLKQQSRLLLINEER